uniref:Uncharacterized protein n=1 Tax=Arundo donax TaxID=35708 RepID=A0A0A9FD07_ARUDO
MDLVWMFDASIGLANREVGDGLNSASI